MKCWLRVLFYLPTLTYPLTLPPSGNVEMSAVLSEEGWAWLVCGRRLLVWKYRQEESRSRLVNHQFRELTLPPSDLAHRAQLVVVYTPAEGQVGVSVNHLFLYLLPKEADRVSV